MGERKGEWGRSTRYIAGGGDKNVSLGKLEEGVCSSCGIKGVNNLLGRKGGLLDCPVDDVYETLCRRSNRCSQDCVSDPRRTPNPAREPGRKTCVAIRSGMEAKPKMDEAVARRTLSYDCTRGLIKAGPDTC